MAIGQAPAADRRLFVLWGLRVAFFASVLALAVVAETPRRTDAAADPAPTSAPSPQPTYLWHFARTVTVEVSGGSIFGNQHSTLTLVQQRTGVAPSVEDARLDALIDAVSADCVPRLTSAGVGLTPELMHGLTAEQVHYGGHISPGQRRWYDASFDQAALEDIVQRYFAYNPAPVDGEFTNVRVSVMDSTGVVLSAESTANQVLLLPWYVNHGNQGTCTSWDPRLSRAIAPYLSGDFAERARGTVLAQTIARDYVRHNAASWDTLGARDRYGRELNHLPSQYRLLFAAICGDGVHNCKDDNFLLLHVGTRTAGSNVHFEIDVPIDGAGRLVGWNDALTGIPAASVLLSRFAPLAAVLDAPRHVVSVQLPPYTKRIGAQIVGSCEVGEDLLQGTKPDTALSLSVGEPKPPDATF